MRTLVLAAACAALLGMPAQAKELKEYPSEAKAQAHCPKDEIVWSEVKGGGLFHVKGAPRYGKSPDGGYLCRKEAERAGWHEFRKPE